MPNNIDNAIKAAVRSMSEVVVPSLDPDNPLAGEQAALVVQLLDFLRYRVPYLQQRDRAELVIYYNMAAKLLQELAILLPRQVDKVVDDLEAAAEAILDPAPAPEDVTKLSNDLRSTLSELVHAAADAPEPLRQKIELAVVIGSKPILDLQRVWFFPTGMVPNDDDLPELGELLRSNPDAVQTI